MNGSVKQCSEFVPFTWIRLEVTFGYHGCPTRLILLPAKSVMMVRENSHGSRNPLNGLAPKWMVLKRATDAQPLT